MKESKPQVRKVLPSLQTSDTEICFDYRFQSYGQKKEKGYNTLMRVM